MVALNLNMITIFLQMFRILLHALKCLLAVLASATLWALVLQMLSQVLDVVLLHRSCRIIFTVQFLRTLIGMLTAVRCLQHADQLGEVDWVWLNLESSEHIYKLILTWSCAFTKPILEG